MRMAMQNKVIDNFWKVFYLRCVFVTKATLLLLKSRSLNNHIVVNESPKK